MNRLMIYVLMIKTFVFNITSPPSILWHLVNLELETNMAEVCGSGRDFSFWRNLTVYEGLRKQKISKYVTLYPPSLLPLKSFIFNQPNIVLNICPPPFRFFGAKIYSIYRFSLTENSKEIYKCDRDYLRVLGKEAVNMISCFI